MSTITWDDDHSKYGTWPTVFSGVQFQIRLTNLTIIPLDKIELFLKAKFIENYITLEI